MLEELLATLLSESLSRSRALSPDEGSLGAPNVEEELANHEESIAKTKAMILLSARTSNYSGKHQGIVYALVTVLETASRTALSEQSREEVEHRYNAALAQLKAPEESPQRQALTPVMPAPTPQVSSRRARKTPLAGHEEVIEQRYRGGEPMSVIAADYSVQKQAIQQLLRRRGVGFSDRRAFLDGRIREMAAQGKTVNEIAVEMGFVHETIKSALRRMGLAPTWNTPWRNRIADEDVVTILTLREQGHTLQAIADSLRISQSVVSKYLIQNGRRTQTHSPKSKQSLP